ncbi:MAG: helix-turn-helix domain-containing protein, partial [Actinomycetota bacterium]
GLHAAPATIRHDGNQFGIQLGLTPLGARALLGVPPSALGSLVVPLEDLLPEAGELLDRLRAGADWAGRFAVVDDVLTRVLTEPRPVRPEVLQAWSMLCRTDGAVTVAAIADEVGWSRRHLSGRFRDEYGLSPKITGQVLRFEAANELLRASPQPSLAEVAARCGYADQAHLTRDWRRFAGSSPTEWMGSEEFMHSEAIADVSAGP